MLQYAEECINKGENSEEKIIGKGVKFQRIRRITGYLVGTVDRFCDSKRKELNDRVVHIGPNFGKVSKII